VHEFPVITPKKYFEVRINQILPSKEGGRRSNIAFIRKFCNDHAEKNGIAVFYFRGNFFGVNKSQSFLTPTNLRPAQISEIYPKKANLVTLPINVFSRCYINSQNTQSEIISTVQQSKVSEITECRQYAISIPTYIPPKQNCYHIHPIQYEVCIACLQ